LVYYKPKPFIYVDYDRYIILGGENMKKIALLMVLLIVFSSLLVLAKQDPVMVKAGNPQAISEEDIEDDADEDELEEEEETEVEDDMGERGKEGKPLLPKQEMTRVENQNRIRLAVHALLDVENRTGGIGKNISAIAREFNNRINKTAQLEEKLEKRSKLRRFFAGGDKESSEELELEVNKTMNRLKELRELRSQCDCSEEIKAMIQEQIQQMDQEQDRLSGLADKERKSKGIFGWLWK
jgi:hypothetical protein